MSPLRVFLLSLSLVVATPWLARAQQPEEAERGTEPSERTNFDRASDERGRPSEPGTGAESGARPVQEAQREATAQDAEVILPLQAGVRLERPEEAEGEAIDEDRPPPPLGAPRPLTAGRAAMWIPRVALFPLYLVSDYVVRRPIGFVVENVERHHVIERVRDATSFGDGDGPASDGGVLPRLRFDRHLRPAIGLEFYLIDAIVPGNDWTVGADTDFAQNGSADVGTQLRLKNDRLVFGTGGSFVRRADNVFHGLGPQVDERSESRFVSRSFEGGLWTSYRPIFPGVGGRIGGSASDHHFDCSPEEVLDLCGDDHEIGTVDDGFAEGALPYFLTGYQLMELDTALFVDSRTFDPRSGTGVRGELFGTFGQGINAADDLRFVRVGSELGAFLDVYRGRVLGLRVRGELAEPIGPESLPFTELAMLGGISSMRGFLEGRFRGRSSFVTSLEYRYPIWSFIDGFLFAEAGNAFDEWFDGLSPGALQGSFGAGLRSAEGSLVPLDLLVGIGTSRFDEGLDIEFARVTLGTTWRL